MTARLWNEVDKFTTWATDMLKAIPAALEAIPREAAEETALEIKNSILSQSISWAPLYHAYVKWKEQHRLHPGILIATGFYANNMQAIKEAPFRYTAGVPAIPHPPLLGRWPVPSLPALMQIHEFGAVVSTPAPLGAKMRAIPARPHVRNAQKKMISRVAKIIVAKGFKLLFAK